MELHPQEKGYCFPSNKKQIAQGKWSVFAAIEKIYKMLPLYPSHIPPIPPSAVNSIEENERRSEPQRVGIMLPMEDPIIMPIQMSDF